MSPIRRYLIAGLLVWLPLGVTVLIIKLLVGLVEQMLDLVPPQYRLEVLVGMEIPYLEVFVALISMIIIMFVTGLFAANLFGRKLVQLWENILGRIPLVRSIYQSAKQVAETVFSSSGNSFRKVLLIEYPRKGLYTLAFQTGDSEGEVQNTLGEELVSVYVPTTPNPTSGFLLFLPKSEVTELEMSVDEALKMVISLGMIEPQWPRPANSQKLPPSEVA